MATLPQGEIPLKTQCWRWLSVPIVCCECFPLGKAGALEIDGTLYGVLVNGELPPQGEPLVRGWRLTNQVNGQVYDLEQDHPVRCDCKGYTRWQRCKHVRCLTAALEALVPRPSKAATAPAVLLDFATDEREGEDFADQREVLRPKEDFSRDEPLEAL